jgi:hypothetical protein
MSKNQTLADALDAAGHGHQKKLATEALLNLTNDECSRLLSGEDMGLEDADKKAFNNLVRERINHGQPILPFSKMDVSGGGTMDPNW